MDCNCTRIGSEAHLYSIIISQEKKHSFNKLIHIIMIQIFTESCMVQHYPQNIFSIKLFPTYN